MLHLPFILGSGCLLDYFDMNLILSWGVSSLLSSCVVRCQESLCWQLVVSALVTAFTVRNFLPERGDLYSPKCLWSFGLPWIARIGEASGKWPRVAWPGGSEQDPWGCTHPTQPWHHLYWWEPLGLLPSPAARQLLMSSVLSLVIVVWAVFALPTGILAADVSACYAMEARSDSAHLLPSSLSGSLCRWGRER